MKTTVIGETTILSFRRDVRTCHMTFRLRWCSAKTQRPVAYCSGGQETVLIPVSYR